MNTWLRLGRAMLVRAPMRSACALILACVAALALSSGIASADLTQIAKLSGAGPIGSPREGKAVAISADGKTAAVGGWYDNEGEGAVWIFIRTGNTWAEEAKLVTRVGSGPQPKAELGMSVAISDNGNTVIIGAPRDEYGVSGARGAAWVFNRSGNTWTQKQKLVGANSTVAAEQGTSVAMSADGNTVVIGGPGDSYIDVIGGQRHGAFWTFTRTNDLWTQQGGKVARSADNTIDFGKAISLSADGNTAVVGSRGYAWFFNRSAAGEWTPAGGGVKSGNEAFQTPFGASVALTRDGQVAVIGSPDLEDSHTFYNNGSAYLYFRGQNGWLPGKRLLGTDSSGYQGYAVAIAGDANALTVLSSSRNDNSNRGAVWMFGGSVTNAAQVGSKITGTLTSPGPEFGSSLAMTPDGTTILVGAPRENPSATDDVGSAIVFTQPKLTTPTAHDFNADGKSDVLWRSTSGQTGIWFMNGATLLSAPSLGVVSNDWSIVGQRDFNGDGKSDLLWRNSAGDIGLWFMNGASYTPVGIGNVSTNWVVIGTGDFNGDGKADILWRSTSHDIAIWFMNGATIVGSAGLGNVGPTWFVVGTGDFDGDGKADILWRNTSHDIGVWFMNGGAIAGLANLGNVGPTWWVAGLGDFNGDGKGDILWSSTSHEVGIWFMNGPSIISTPFLGNVGPTWSIVSTGDYNGDGKTDILWRSTGHDIGFWFMNGAATASAVGVGNVGPTWLVQNAASN